MSLLRWFDAKEVDEFADSIIAAVRDRLPPSGAEVAGAKDAERLRRSFGQIVARVDAFCQGHRLNLYTKARFANRVKWALKDAGYPGAFVDTFTQELVTHVALASRKHAK